VHQYGLNMVIDCMPYGHPAGTDRLGCLSQEGVSYLSSCLFRRDMAEGLMRFYITAFYDSRNAQAVS
jgi:hypothetical protein